MEPLFRRAQPSDCEGAVPLVYSSGPDVLDYCFRAGGRTAADFLRYAFSDGRGFFGWRTHTAVVHGPRLVGVGAFYGGRDHARLSRELVVQVVRFYPLVAALGVIRRTLQVRVIMPPPPRSTHYAANLGVPPDLRGRGIGTVLLSHEAAAAHRVGRRTLALDVTVNNPRAQALYERLGFAVTRYQESPCSPGGLPSSRRMERTLPVGPPMGDGAATAVPALSVAATA
ncbi:N-acetyltransferase [Rubrivirga sp. S365]|uniref:GNAT family N-acetyltransferase n=1 Tax=Rubrivirga sp. S365 TaxID=3076080 RepID=UPI0028C82372|nr:N-acetyltransferase [Rubrivirga sp. S365]MDT7858195.1 N-acetyltransferase [Rubrivirga sp. S365]